MLSHLLNQELNFMRSMGVGADLDAVMNRILMQHEPNAQPTPDQVLQRFPRRQGVSEAEKTTDRMLQEPCSICQEEFTVESAEMLQLPCGHWFHSACIEPWLQRAQSCPSCRSNVTMQRNTA
jgi:hypothetical protein